MLGDVLRLRKPIPFFVQCKRDNGHRAGRIHPDAPGGPGRRPVCWRAAAVRPGFAHTSGGRMRLLVTGGAGYIGSVVASALIEAGHDVTVLDDLSTGHADAVPPKATFVRGTLRDDAARVLADGTDAVLHFAAKSLGGESVANPGLYWSHNLGGSLALLEAMRE